MVNDLGGSSWELTCQLLHQRHGRTGYCGEARCRFGKAVLLGQGGWRMAGGVSLMEAELFL